MRPQSGYKARPTFIDIYSALDDNERERYRAEHPEEARTVSTYFQKVREERFQQGRQQGEQLGEQRGEARILLRQMRLKFGEIPDEIRRHVEEADAEMLLTAERIEDVVR